MPSVGVLLYSAEAMIGSLTVTVHAEDSDRDVIGALLPVLTDNASDEERERLGERFAAQTGSAEVRPDAGGPAPDSGSDAEPTKAELYEQAKDADIPGRSSMTKDELAKAISEQG